MQLSTCALLAMCLVTLMVASAPGVSSVPAPGRGGPWPIRLRQVDDETAPDDDEAPLQTKKRFWGAFLIGAAAAKIIGKREQPTTADDDGDQPMTADDAGDQSEVLMLEEASEDDLINDGAGRGIVCVGQACTFWPEELAVVAKPGVKVQDEEPEVSEDNGAAEGEARKRCFGSCGRIRI